MLFLERNTVQPVGKKATDLLESSDSSAKKDFDFVPDVPPKTNR